MTRPAVRVQREIAWQLGDLTPPDKLDLDRPFPEEHWPVPNVIELHTGPIKARGTTVRLYYEEDDAGPFADARATEEVLDFEGPCILWAWLNKRRDFRTVSPGNRLLDRFVRLRDSADTEILKFVQRFGPLMLCSHGLPACHHAYDGVRGFCGHLVLVDGNQGNGDRRTVYSVEPLQYWRRLAAVATSILNLASEINRGREGDVADWQLAYRMLAPDIFHLDFDETSRGTEWYNALRGTREAREIAPRVLGMFADLWLSYAELRPTLINESRQAAFRLQSQRAPMFGHLAMALALVISRHNGIAICANCGDTYTPKRRPDPARRNYCPKDRCRRLAAWRDAARERRSRHRNNCEAQIR